MSFRTRWVLLTCCGLAMVLVAAVVLVLIFFPGWSSASHNALEEHQAEAMAIRELVRWARKTDAKVAEDQLVGAVCLVARAHSTGHKHFVFEFNRKKMVPAILAVYVSSSADEVEVNVSDVAPRDADGHSTEAGYVPNCGK